MREFQGACRESYFDSGRPSEFEYPRHHSAVKMNSCISNTVNSYEGHILCTPLSAPDGFNYNPYATGSPVSRSRTSLTIQVNHLMGLEMCIEMKSMDIHWPARMFGNLGSVDAAFVLS